MNPGENDPLWRVRHGLAGVALALVVSIPLAAWLGSWIGDAAGGTYGWLVSVYAALLVHLVTGAIVLFARVARHEQRRVSLGRVGLWLASLWLWPLLWLSGRERARARHGDRTDA